MLPTTTTRALLLTIPWEAPPKLSESVVMAERKAFLQPDTIPDAKYKQRGPSSPVLCGWSGTLYAGNDHVVGAGNLRSPAVRATIKSRQALCTGRHGNLTR